MGVGSGSAQPGEQRRAMTQQKKTLCVDFDGVLHSYTSGWQGPGVVADGPVPGAIEWLSWLTECYEVCVYSSRSKVTEGQRAMADAIFRWASDILDKCHAIRLVNKLQFPTQKPAAWLTIDDRCICFEGKFPTLEEIDGFVPWNKRP